MQRINYRVQTYNLSKIGRTVNLHPHGSSESIMRYPKLFVDAVDEGLEVLGEAPKNIIYELLEADYAMQRDEIPIRFVEFSKALRDTIGLAVDPLLRFIVDNFFLKIDKEPPRWADLNESIQAIEQILRDKLVQETKFSNRQGAGAAEKR